MGYQADTVREAYEEWENRHFAKIPKTLNHLFPDGVRHRDVMEYINGQLDFRDLLNNT